MPQNGLHGIVGLAVARWVAPRIPAAATEHLIAGTVLGAMLPDIDLYPTAIVFLLGRHDLVYAIHRTLTHSLLAVLLVAGLGAALRRRSPAGAWLCGGMALGMLTHVTLDLFFWFAQIDLFWPLNDLPAGAPLLPVINLWAGVKLPALFGEEHFWEKLLGAIELAAFALYLMALRRITGPGRTKGDAVGRLGLWERWAWASFAVTLAGVFVLWYTLQDVLVHIPYLLLFAPLCWFQTWRLREAIARWARKR